MSRLYVVTGGGSGTGRAVAARLTRAGNRVVLWGRDGDKLAAAVGAGDAVGSHAANLADPDQVDAAARTVLEAYGPIDGFVHCAGIWTKGGLTEVTPATIDLHLRSVTMAAVLCLRAAIGLFGPQGGRMVQIAAASAKPGFPDTALNVLAKRAQDGLHEGLVRELKGTAIQLTTVYPDSIGPAGSDGVREGYAMSYEDVADAILYALAASSSAHIQEIVLTARKTGR